MNNLPAQTGYYAKYQLVNKVSREKISFQWSFPDLFSIQLKIQIYWKVY